MVYRDQLARLTALIEAGMPLPADLAAWALRCLADALPVEALRRQRDDHLRRAGALVGGSARAQARAITDAASRLARARRSGDSDDALRAEVRRAMLLAPIPGERRLRIILSGDDLERAA